MRQAPRTSRRRRSARPSGLRLPDRVLAGEPPFKYLEPGIRLKIARWSTAASREEPGFTMNQRHYIVTLHEGLSPGRTTDVQDRISCCRTFACVGAGLRPRQLGECPARRPQGP